MQELDFSYVSGGGRAENELVFRVRPSDNHAVYRCAASNQMTSQPLNTDLRLTVQCTHRTAAHRTSHVAPTSIIYRIYRSHQSLMTMVALVSTGCKAV